jgi:hypothetical protein
LDDAVKGMANALVMTFAMLITELDKTGAISKSDFASLLERTAEDAETNAPPHLKERDRVDLKLMRMIAGHLKSPQPAGWTPIVIEGGREGS